LSIVVDARSAGTPLRTSWTLNSHGGGVYRSGGRRAQLGADWSRRTRGCAHLRRRTLNPNILIAGAIDGVYWSADSGKNWERISPENHADLRNFDSIAIDPHDPNTIYAGTYHLPWKTVDGGKKLGADSSRHGGRFGRHDPSRSIRMMRRTFSPAHVPAFTTALMAGVLDEIQGNSKDSLRTVHILQDPKRPHTVYAATTEGSGKRPMMAPLGAW